MVAALIILLILGPIAEIYVLLISAQAFGVWPVIAGCLATAFIGGAVLRIQGLAAMRGAERDLRDGRIPVEAAVDGLFLAIAAPMLMTPGFLTDAFGFALLVPPVRRFIARRALAMLRNRLASAEITVIRPD